MHIHFEGLDLAGKTTVCKRFIKHAKGEWEHRRNALTTNNHIFQTADKMRLEKQNEQVVGEYYLNALILDLEQFDPPTNHVVQDSTILLRSLCYHKAMGRNDLAKRFETLVKQHPRFDRSFVCKASREVRLQRLQKRKKENLGPEDFIIRDNPKLFDEMEETLINSAQKYFNATVIDTSELEKDETIQTVFQHLPGLQKNP